MRKRNLHSTFIINVSSKAEFGNLGLDPSHFSLVLSSDGSGKKVSVETTKLPLVEFVICNEKGFLVRCNRNNLRMWESEKFESFENAKKLLTFCGYFTNLNNNFLYLKARKVRAL